MTTATATIPLPVSVNAGARLLGEVIAWACPGLSVGHSNLVSALTDSVLDAGVARELAPRHDFARACKKLSEQRIIRPVAEDAATIKFQFTQESRSDDRFEYTLETMLTLDKQSGSVTCELPGLATMAQEELDRCIAVRTGSDVTRIVQKLFERQADLFAIRPAGGTYFVPARHAGFVDRIQDFLNRVGGRLLRFPVPAGTDEGDRSVTVAVSGHDDTTTDVKELPLPGSSVTGPPAKSVLDRRALARMLALGSSMLRFTPGKAVVGVGEEVTVLVAPLDPQLASPATDHSKPVTEQSHSDNPIPNPERNAMKPDTTGAHNGRRDPPQDEGIDPLVAAEELRLALSEVLAKAMRLVTALKATRKEKKVLSAVLSGLKQLNLGSGDPR